MVLFTDQEETKALFGVVRDMHLVGRFVWLGSDAVGLNLDDMDDLEHAALGALTLNAFTKDVPTFQEHFKSLSPRRAKENPWFGRMWGIMFNCSWNQTESLLLNIALCKEDATITDAEQANDLPKVYMAERTASLYIDAIDVYADAVGRLLAADCPNARGRKVFINLDPFKVIL